jgi:hypothetical protein
VVKRGISNPFELLLISSMALLSGGEPSLLIATLCANNIAGNITDTRKNIFFMMMV